LNYCGQMLWLSGLFLSVFARNVPLNSKGYSAPQPDPVYEPDIGQTNMDGYGVTTKPYCHMEEKISFVNQCEPYNENLLDAERGRMLPCAV